MPPETSPSLLVSISIVSHGQTTLVTRLLKSISEHEDNRKLEIILTENIPTEIVDIKQLNYYNLNQIVNPKPKGFGANHNQASKLAKGEYFCILNPDVVFIESLFPQLIDHINHGRGDIVAPLIVDSQNEIQDSFRSIPTPGELILRRLNRKPDISQHSEIKLIYPDWIAGIFLFTRWDTFDQLGGFDERYYIYFEDVDFSSRARSQGLRPFVNTQSRVLHDAQRKSRRNLSHLIYHTISAVRFFSSSAYRAARKLK